MISLGGNKGSQGRNRMTREKHSEIKGRKDDVIYNLRCSKE